MILLSSACSIQHTSIFSIHLWWSINSQTFSLWQCSWVRYTFTAYMDPHKSPSCTQWNRRGKILFKPALNLLDFFTTFAPMQSCFLNKMTFQQSQKLNVIMFGEQVCHVLNIAHGLAKLCNCWIVFLSKAHVCCKKTEKSEQQNCAEGCLIFSE